MPCARRPQAWYKTRRARPATGAPAWRVVTVFKQLLQPLLWFCLLTSILLLASGLALNAATSTPDVHPHSNQAT